MRTTQMQAIIRVTATPYQSTETIFNDLLIASNTLGISTRLHNQGENLPNNELFFSILLIMRNDASPMFMVGMNGGDQIVVGTKESGKPLLLHDSWPFPLVSLIVGHPATHLENLGRSPANCIAAVIDEGHLGFFDDVDVPPRTRLFCPHGGPEAVPDPLPAQDRNIDVLFSGTIDDQDSFDDWLDRLSNRSPDRKAALKEAFEAVYEGNAEVYRALSESFTRHKQNTRPRFLAPFVTALDAYVTQRRRIEVLEAIRGCRVVVLGKVGPKAAERLSHHDLRGETTFIRMLSMAAESRILLNSRKTFARGAHERIFYGLSRGAVVVTDPSTFLEDDFERGLGMVKQPEDLKTLNQLVSDLCADSDMLDRLRAQGLETYPERHTWRERMKRLLPAVIRHLEEQE